MAKKLGKSEKLDLILSELKSLRTDIKKLLKQGGERQAADKSRSARPPRPQPAKKEKAKRARSRTPTKAPTRPVLVDAAESDAPAANLTSRIA